VILRVPASSWRLSPVDCASDEYNLFVIYTASTAWLEALNDAGIAFIFANPGSDHPGIIDALAEAKALGRAAPR
jgi:hypothetical protein